jgi:hypothetical protein
VIVTKVLLIAAVAFGVGACSIQRAQVAGAAQHDMVGLTKEQVLACMGPPANKASEGATEVWSYDSGNGHTQVSTFGQSYTNASLYGGSGFASTLNSGFGVSTRRYCTVNVVMSDGRVSRVNYSGPTGGLLTAGEQCAFAVQNCVQQPSLATR